MTESSYMEGKREQVLSHRDYQKGLEIFEKASNKFAVIFGENDIITGKSWPLQTGTPAFEIKKSGHSPMIEQPAQLSKTSKDFLTF